MSNIIFAQTAFPKNRYTQKEMMDFVKTIWKEHPEVIDRLAKTSHVDFKSLVLPLENYQDLGGFEWRNNHYIKIISELLKESLEKLLDQVSFDFKDVAYLTSTSITGISVPSLDARLMNQFPFSGQTIRTPLFGVGCLGGIATINRTLPKTLVFELLKNDIQQRRLCHLPYFGL